MLVILFSLKTVESLENGLQPQSGETPFFSINTESLASSQSCRSIDVDAWCKWALSSTVLLLHLPVWFVRLWFVCIGSRHPHGPLVLVILLVHIHVPVQRGRQARLTIVMAYLYWRRQTRRRTRKQIPNPMATLYCAEFFTLHRLEL